MRMRIRYTTNITFRKRVGEEGSAHFMIIMLKLLPTRKMGNVKLSAYPINPESPVRIENIFQPIVSSVKLPKHQRRRIPMTKLVMSMYTKGAVKSL